MRPLGARWASLGDKSSRRGLLSAAGLSSQAARRTRRRAGLVSVATRLASDRGLRAELAQTVADLNQAWVRLEPANKSHRRRNTFVLAAGTAAVAAVAKLRKRANLSPTGHRRQNDRFAPHVGSTGAADRGPQRDQDPDGLAELTRQELYARAQQSQIAGRSKMSKEDLIAALRAKHSN
jgi:hypothetical protein